MAAFPSVISYRMMFKGGEVGGKKKKPTKGFNQAISLKNINAKYANLHLTDH